MKVTYQPICSFHVDCGDRGTDGVAINFLLVELSTQDHFISS